METLESKIKMMNREILSLKTSCPLSSSMRTYYGKYSLPVLGDNKIHTYEITYTPSTQPIMTQIYCNSNFSFVLLSPVGDKQKICDIRLNSYEGDREVLVMSSRQILGVRKIS